MASQTSLNEDLSLLKNPTDGDEISMNSWMTNSTQYIADIDKRAKKFYSGLIFASTTLLLVIECFLSWSLYGDLVRIERGLVYGPFSETVTKCVFTFAIIGTITTLVGLCNNAMEFLTDRNHCDNNVLLIIILAVQVVPSGINNLYFAGCQEVPATSLQFVRAAFLFISCLLLLVIMIGRKYLEREVLENTETKRWQHINIIIISGISLLLFILAIAIFIMLKHIPTSKFREMKARKFHGMQHKVISSYFENVAIFFNPPFLNCAKIGKLNIGSIYDVELSGTRGYDVIYYQNSAYISLKINDKMKIRDYCYKVTKECDLIENNLCSKIQSEADLKMKMRLGFEQPTEFKRMGDLYADVLIHNRTKCEKIMTQNQLSFYLEFEKKTKEIFTIPTIEKTGGHKRFYEEETDIIPVEKLWETGSLGCIATGYTQPHLNDLGLQCK